MATELTIENPYGSAGKPAIGASSTFVNPVPSLLPRYRPPLVAMNAWPAPSNLMSPIMWPTNREAPIGSQLLPASVERCRPVPA
jgi:hypothetical protein